MYVERIKASDEKLTAEDHLIKLKTVLGQISTQGQCCSLEKDIKTRVDLCIAMCDVVRKKFADEKKQMEDQLHKLCDDSGEYFTTHCYAMELRHYSGTCPK